MLVDSHCHLDILDLTKYRGSLEAALQAAAVVGVQYFLCPGVDFERLPDIMRLARTHRNVVASVGLHPTELEGYRVSVAELCRLADDPLVVGIGETGLDYSHVASEESRLEQQLRFITHIRAAKELHKPLVIHSRAAAADLLRILREEQAEVVGGVLHCFTEDWETAAQAMAMNFYISFSGIITFKNAEALRQVAQKVPLQNMLVETDAPFLAPVPYRGQTNEPAYLRYVAEYMAELRAITYQELSEITTANFAQLFGLRDQAGEDYLKTVLPQCGAIINAE